MATGKRRKTMKPSYITIDNSNDLKLVHDDVVDNIKCELGISFKRTLRIPDDNKKYNLPPSLGNFPLKHVEDYQNVPQSWKEHGGVFLPMYQSEAMWLSFNSRWPFAIKIAAGKINAVSGETWNPQLLKLNKVAQAYDSATRPTYPYTVCAGKNCITMEDPFAHLNTIAQKPDYIVAPKQPWLDGFNVGKGLIRQFIAMPLGAGYTVEEQLTNKAEHGGIQIIAYPMKKEAYEKIRAEERRKELEYLNRPISMNMITAQAASKGILRSATNNASQEMGLGAGGFMKQDIYEDPYEGDVWDTTKPLKVFVHLLNSNEYLQVTGENPPTKPLTPREYSRYNYPWFDYYDDGAVLSGSEKLSKIESVGALQIKKDENVLIDNSSFNQPQPHVLGQKIVKSGKW